MQLHSIECFHKDVKWLQSFQIRPDPSYSSKWKQRLLMFMVIFLYHCRRHNAAIILNLKSISAKYTNGCTCVKKAILLIVTFQQNSLRQCVSQRFIRFLLNDILISGNSSCIQFLYPLNDI